MARRHRRHITLLAVSSAKEIAEASVDDGPSGGGGDGPSDGGNGDPSGGGNDVDDDPSHCKNGLVHVTRKS